jgi:HSP20 family protein
MSEAPLNDFDRADKSPPLVSAAAPKASSRDEPEAEAPGPRRVTVPTGSDVTRVWKSVDYGALFAWAKPFVPTVASTLKFRGVLSADEPDLNLAETENEYRIVAALPGLSASDIVLTIDGDALSIDAEHDSGTAEGEAEAHISELKLGRLHRKLRLPGPVGKAEAAFENGLLTVVLAKKNVSPRRIRVKSSGADD